MTRQFLSEASRALGDTVQKQANQNIRILRQRIGKRRLPETLAFIDCLETNLHAAFGEVRQWVGLTTERVNSVPFKVSEVVQLHLISTALFSVDKLRVKTLVTRELELEQINPEPHIQGKYLELFEVVSHNLISNAMKYSGEGLKTRVDFHVAISDGQVKIRCINSVSAGEIDKTLLQHGATVAQARTKESGLARKDHASGFQKIRAAAERVTGKQPRFNIPPPNLKQRSYIVEVIIPTPANVQSSQ